MVWHVVVVLIDGKILNVSALRSNRNQDSHFRLRCIMAGHV